MGGNLQYHFMWFDSAISQVAASSGTWEQEEEKKQVSGGS